MQAMLELDADSFAVKKAAIDKLAHTHDPRMIPFLENFTRGSVYIWNGTVVVSNETRETADGKLALLLDPFTLMPMMNGPDPVTCPFKQLKPVEAGRRERGLVRDAHVLLRLYNPDRDARHSAAVKCGDIGDESNLPALKECLQQETDGKVRAALEESIELLTLVAGDSTDDERVKAVQKLGELRATRALSVLKDMQSKNPPPALAAALKTSIAGIERWQTIARGFGYVFSGISLGTILVLMALGLSIIFGMMGVINMAHGELMMIGAYATFLTQKTFEYAIVRHWLPQGAFDWYFIAAIPAAFLTAALAGYLIEILIIRHLYGRPLETLLATFGVSLILIQAVRMEFGDNIAVNSPSWLQGGAEVMPDIVLPYNRCFIIGFCILCVLLMYFLVNRTKLGLLLRATTQNRGMAASLGIATRRIDGYTFALGAGLAGLAGCALTQIGGVTPDMGQNYVVDSFLVVVTGGVGKLAGAIWAGFGLGCLEKIFEPFFQAIWAKVLILALIVLFIQKRPSGLFPAKGRLADV